MYSKITPENESKELDPKMEKMTEADIVTVMKIESDSFPFPWKDKMNFIRCAKSGDAFVVRTKQNVIVGYVLIERKDGEIVLTKMAINPEYRRKGLGRFIICWSQKFVNDQSVQRLRLHVRASNHKAIKLYKKTGFEELRRIKNGYGKGSSAEERTAIEMQWVCR